VANPTSILAVILTVHDDHFKSKIEILPGRIKGPRFDTSKDNTPLPPPIDRRGFRAVRSWNLRPKLGRKISFFFQFFSLSASSTSFSTTFSATTTSAARDQKRPNLLHQPICSPVTVTTTTITANFFIFFLSIAVFLHLRSINFSTLPSLAATPLYQTS